MKYDIVISTSHKNKELASKVASELMSMGFKVYSPNFSHGKSEEEIDDNFIKFLLDEHLEAIDNGKILYVICVEGNVGKSVSSEIGYAKAKELKIIFSEKPLDLGINAYAEDYISIDSLNTFLNI
ncbi:hypothetical protein KC678_01895 [Candidatus Dojkabacteria bacterium]|uniref:Uncharacterized protein n=1 Tax=Candidatus Dojkabacteria bacterium TaxID=2099670 RepID=A0A955IAY0_9BACT|nr:hypothetical protein [Candidatus Dojkabacteria bacterium]